MNIKKKYLYRYIGISRRYGSEIDMCKKSYNWKVCMYVLSIFFVIFIRVYMGEKSFVNFTPKWDHVDFQNVFFVCNKMLSNEQYE